MSRSQLNDRASKELLKVESKRLHKHQVLKHNRFEQVLVFLLSYAAYCILYSVRKPFSVVKTTLTKELKFSIADLGRIDTSFLAAYAIGQLVLPAYSQQYATPCTVVSVAFLGSCLCATLFGLSSSGVVMAVTWGINGLFHSVVYPLTVRTLAGWFGPEVRGRVLGTWTTSQQLGSAFATAFATYAAGHWGWRSAFLVPAAFNLVMGVLNYLFMPQKPHNKDVNAARSPSTRSSTAKGKIESVNKFSAESVNRPYCDGGGLIINQTMAFPEDSGLQRASLVGAPKLSARLQRVSMALQHNTLNGDVGAMPSYTFRADSGRLRLDSSHHLCETDVTTPLQSPSWRRSPWFTGSVKFDSNQSSIRPSTRTMSAESVEEHGSLPKINLMRVLNIHDVKAVAVAFFFIKYVRYSLLMWLPMYLEAAIKLDRKTAGYLSIVFDVGGVPGAVFTGWVSDRVLHGRRLLTACIMSVAAVASVVIFQVFAGHEAVGMTAFCLGVLGFSIAGPDSILGAAAAQDLCDRSPYGIHAVSIAAGVINGMGSSGAVFQGIFTPGIVTNFGWRSFFTILCALLFLSMTFLLVSLRREYLQYRDRNELRSWHGRG